MSLPPDYGYQPPIDPVDDMPLGLQIAAIGQYVAGVIVIAVGGFVIVTFSGEYPFSAPFSGALIVALGVWKIFLGRATQKRLGTAIEWIYPSSFLSFFVFLGLTVVFVPAPLIEVAIVVLTVTQWDRFPQREERRAAANRARESEE